MTIYLTKEDIQKQTDPLREQLAVPDHRAKCIINAIWREINEKQKFNAFQTQIAAELRIQRLFRLYHSQIFI